MFRFTVRVENGDLNEKLPRKFQLPLKGVNEISEFDVDKIKEIIREKYISQNRSLEGRIFYVQSIEKFKRGALGKIVEVGVVFG